MTDLPQKAMKSLTIGATTATALYLLGGDAAKQNVFGLPLALSVGMLNGLTSLSTQFVHDSLLSHIPHNERFAQTETVLLNGGASFAIPSGVLYLKGNIPDVGNAVKLGGVCAGSDILGDYIYEKILHDMVFGATNRLPKKQARV